MRYHKRYISVVLLCILLTCYISLSYIVHKKYDILYMLQRDEIFANSIFQNGIIKHMAENNNNEKIKSSNFNLSHIWPIQGGQNNDRILEQLEYRPTVRKWKTILLLDGWSEGDNGNNRLISDRCAVQSCTFTRDRTFIDAADAVAFQYSIYQPKRADQIWVLYQLESPDWTLEYGDIMPSHITATYRRDSVLVTPYAKFVPYSSNTTNQQEVNYAEGKHKNVAWFVSNCNAKNGRFNYAKELGMHISVDIFGGCGDKECLRVNEKGCDDMLRQEYKFYLAFENSNCVDYITEKFFTRALLNNILPIVMGARREDYEAVAPPHSFIHVEDFSSPKELAWYLHLLNRRDDLYNSYFRWKDTGEFINTKFFCRLCSMVHGISEVSIVYKDINKWWGGEGVCVHPTNNDTWAKWNIS